MAFARLQITVIRALGGVRRQLVAVATGLQPLAVRAWMHLRHPTRRGVALALAAVPLLVLLYALLLIPFTPGIDDLRKAKLEAPAVVLSADGRELAVFKRANRDWVKLQDISPNVSNLWVSSKVLAPKRAEAAAASQPAWPPPITITS